MNSGSREKALLKEGDDKAKTWENKLGFDIDLAPKFS